MITGPHTGAFASVSNGFSADYQPAFIGLVRGSVSTSVGLSSSPNPSVVATR